MARDVSTGFADQVEQHARNIPFNSAEAVDALSIGDQRKLLAELSFRLNKKGAKPDLTTHQQDIWDAMRDTLLAQDSFMSSRDRFLESYGQSEYGERCAFVEDYMEATCGILRRNHRLAVMRVIFDSLCTSMKARSIPLTTKTVLNNIETIPLAVNDDYPGYASSRMLHRVVSPAREERA